MSGNRAIISFSQYKFFNAQSKHFGIRTKNQEKTRQNETSPLQA
jgi:hypothetical protein